MPEYKKGDRVRIIDDDDFLAFYGEYGTVVRIDGDAVLVQTREADDYWFLSHDIEHTDD